MARIQDITTQHNGFNHIRVQSHDDADPIMICVEESGDIKSLSRATQEFPIQTRAGFSIDPSIRNAVSDKGALVYTLLDKGTTHEDWKEAYAITLAMRIHEMNDPIITPTNNPMRDTELDVELDSSCTPSELDLAADNEANDVAKARATMGFTDEELTRIGIQIVPGNEDYIPGTDAENFVKLACGIGMDIHELLTGYSDGFYLSDLLNAIISMKTEGIITLNELESGKYGPVIDFKEPEPLPIEAEPTTDDDDTDDEDSLELDAVHQYIDDDENYNKSIMDRVASQVLDDDEPQPMPPLTTVTASPSTTPTISLEDLPEIQLDGEGKPTPEMEAYANYQTTADVLPAWMDESAPREIPRDDDNIHMNEDETDANPVNDSMIESPIDSPNDTDYVPADVDDSTGLVEETETDTITGLDPVDDSLDIDQVPDDGFDGMTITDTEITKPEPQDDVNETIDDLVGFVSKARRKLASLKEQKVEVDGKISELEKINVDETQALIDSYEEDKKDLEEKIASLRAEKAKVLEDISSARRQKEEQEERLSHLDEYREDSGRIASQIKALQDALS